ncbi:hypothetical protein CONPUDRAFT_43911 [Coniophora puteana RWD-64-598 SS2]|uniref:Zn-finger domain-containing protein n=1 Tax=Coniophora puteana (strain RWD-64-598) TaxID=741705 RepID=A0A5M3N3K2_CONPW|nr:uncharacterized protein CONPUDRAFT_43911 [Coniophora puteana RWD-64-598 SS2]EIW85982.1 hypothetical protein CONPUDRAFT_43911 [Coniophora puteana RWD-64-598 SS2]
MLNSAPSVPTGTRNSIIPPSESLPLHHSSPAPSSPPLAFNTLDDTIDELGALFAPADNVHNAPENTEVDNRASKRARVDEVDGNEGQTTRTRYVQHYPGSAASIYASASTQFETIRDAQDASHTGSYAPFVDKDEWDLSCWLLKNTTKTAADEFLKLPITRDRTKPSYGSAYTWMKQVDQLPTGPAWQCVRIAANQDGDMVPSEGDEESNDDEDDETYELWMRDPVEAVRELIGNPAFKDNIAYAPERTYTDSDGKNQRIDEMWTADWWWQTQEKITPGGTVASVILSTDKTQLSQFRGDKAAYPVYLTLGNISKAVRRQPSKHATMLIGYLPVSKLESFENASLATYRLFHFCMRYILQSLVAAGRNGVYMTCADGNVRLVFPILAAYIADHPEQCLVACCKQNRCPRCLVGRDERGSMKSSAQRQPDETLEILTGQREGAYPPAFIGQGLQDVYAPFWADLPYSNIFSSISSDILHQLHQGVFKDHLLQWCLKLVRGGKEAFDRRFQAMPVYSGLRHFKKGISPITQWTAGEHKQVQRVFIPAFAGSHEDGRVITAARALLDFITLAQYHSHTTETLDRMRKSLKTFHRNKAVFTELEARSGDHFNISKLHSLLHYVETIIALGSLDGLNSENTERLHIDFAKLAYQGTNRKDYVAQMALWLQRREAVALREAYLSWRLCTDAQSSHTNDDPLGLADPPETEEETDTSPIGTHFVAKHPPRPRVSVGTLKQDHGAHGFISALTSYLQEEGLLRPGFVPNEHDHFDVYNGASIYMRPDPHLNPNNLRAQLKSTPRRFNGERKAPTPARWDTVLIEVDKASWLEKGGLNGLRVAELRVVFQLPPHLAVSASQQEPLVYVHLFRRLGSLDPDTQMYKLTRATRQLSPRALVVPLSRVVRPCHITPRFGQGDVPKSWVKGKSMEKATEFLLNRYIDMAMFEDYIVPLT